MTSTYGTIDHPKSGERYAIEVREDGVILRAAGPAPRDEDGRACDPLTGEPLTPDMIEDWLDNAGQDAIDDGEWLQKEFALTS